MEARFLVCKITSPGNAMCGISISMKEFSKLYTKYGVVLCMQKRSCN